MLIAGRMLSNSDEELESFNVLAIGVNARLSGPFSYMRFDRTEVHLDTGTAIHVDETKGIACHGEDYFEVEPGDYVINYLN